MFVSHIKYKVAQVKKPTPQLFLITVLEYMYEIS